MGSAGARRLVRLTAVFAVIVSVSARQTAPGESDAELSTLLKNAQTSFTDHDWNRGAAAYETLIAAARAKGAAVWEGRGILGLGRIANEAARYADARRHATEALAIFERLNATGDIGDANTTLAIAAYSVDDNETAKTHYERAVAAYRTAGNTRARIQASFRLSGLTLGDQTLETLAGLEAEAHAFGDRELEGQILHAWGDDLFRLSLYKPAIEKLNAAVVLFEETKSLDHLGTTYTSLGRLYRAHGQPAAALEFQLKALKIHETMNTPRLLIQSLNAVAVASGAAGDAVQARTYYERALAAAERTGVASYVNFVGANLAGSLIDAEADLDRARLLLERAVAEGAGYTTSLRYTQLTDVNLKLGRLPEALAAAERALNTCPVLLDCVFARLADGRAQLALGHDMAALADQQEALAGIERMHQTLAPSDLLKQNFTRLWEDAYSIAIDLRFRRGEYRAALETSELARSRAFIDLLASRQLERASDAAATLTWRGASTASGVAPSAMTPSLRSEASAAPPTVSDLAAVAARLHSTLLTYWVSANHVYVWALSSDGAVRGASVTIARSKLDELIRSLTPFAPAPGRRPAAATIATRGEDQIAVSPRSQRAWRAMYDVLIAPIERELPRANGARLTIVPYGPLLGVPFAALRDPHGRYLVERYTIHSVPSGAVLQFTADRVSRDSHAGPVLLVGDPAALPRIPGEPPLPRLSGAGEEVRAIARLLPASRTTVLTGSAATEPRVRSALRGKAVIHFATHGIVRDTNPLGSFLALGAAGDGSADGQLTADEIYGLDLDANLIVLSACRSGGGVMTGDGIASLARAFFYAGTPSVIVSVWDVADEPTSRLLPAFYRQWLHGADKAAALRAAQLSLIHRLRAGEIKVTLPVGTFVLPEDPAFWAAFVLLGEPD